jgi:hypothetical protein
LVFSDPPEWLSATVKIGCLDKHISPETGEKSVRAGSQGGALDHNPIIDAGPEMTNRRVASKSLALKSWYRPV